MNGTRLVLCAVFALPVGSSMASALPWSAVIEADAAARRGRGSNAPETRIDRLDGGHGRADHAGMADHVGVGVVDDDEVEHVTLQTLHEFVGHGVGAHLWLVIVGGHVARAGHKDTFLAIDGLLDAAVEEERHMGVLLGLGDVQLPPPVFGEHVGQYVRGILRREGDGHGELPLVLGHRDEVDGRRARASVEPGEPRFDEGARELPATVGAEVEEQTDVPVLDTRVVLGRDDRGHHELIVLAAPIRRLHGGLRIGGHEPVAVYQGIVGHLDAVPARVAIHGIVATADHAETAAAEPVHDLLDLGQIAFGATRQRVAAVEEGVHDHVPDMFAHGEVEARLQVPQIAVHTAV